MLKKGKIEFERIWGVRRIRGSAGRKIVALRDWANRIKSQPIIQGCFSLHPEK